ncbi:MAG: hypothetical protein IJO49_05125 [Clostridia bacterium]|nr:hypothetical protein [Clostridia bacterium]
MYNCIILIFGAVLWKITFILKRGGAYDAAHATEFGLTTVDALGVEGGNMHSLKEFAVLESLKKCAKQAVAIIFEIN